MPSQNILAYNPAVVQYNPPADILRLINQYSNPIGDALTGIAGSMRNLRQDTADNLQNAETLFNFRKKLIDEDIATGAMAWANDPVNAAKLSDWQARSTKSLADANAVDKEMRATLTPELYAYWSKYKDWREMGRSEEKNAAEVDNTYAQAFANRQQGHYYKAQAREHNISADEKEYKFDILQKQNAARQRWNSMSPQERAVVYDKLHSSDRTEVLSAVQALDPTGNTTPEDALSWVTGLEKTFEGIPTNENTQMATIKANMERFQKLAERAAKETAIVEGADLSVADVRDGGASKVKGTTDSDTTKKRELLTSYAQGEGAKVVQDLIDQGIKLDPRLARFMPWIIDHSIEYSGNDWFDDHFKPGKTAVSLDSLVNKKTMEAWLRKINTALSTDKKGIIDQLDLDTGVAARMRQSADARLAQDRITKFNSIRGYAPGYDPMRSIQEAWNQDLKLEDYFIDPNDKAANTKMYQEAFFNGRPITPISGVGTTKTQQDAAKARAKQEALQQPLSIQTTNLMDDRELLFARKQETKPARQNILDNAIKGRKRQRTQEAITAFQSGNPIEAAKIILDSGLVDAADIQKIENPNNSLYFLNLLDEIISGIETQIALLPKNSNQIIPLKSLISRLQAKRKH